MYQMRHPSQIIRISSFIVFLQISLIFRTPPMMYPVISQESFAILTIAILSRYTAHPTAKSISTIGAKKKSSWVSSLMSSCAVNVLIFPEWRKKNEVRHESYAWLSEVNSYLLVSQILPAVVFGSMRRDESCVSADMQRDSCDEGRPLIADLSDYVVVDRTGRGLGSATSAITLPSAQRHAGVLGDGASSFSLASFTG